MNTRSAMMVCGVAAMLPALAGCLEVAVKTRISGDGSVERTVSVKRAERTLPGHAFPLDPSWTGEWRKSGEKDQEYEYTARRSFATPGAFVEEYTGRPDTGAVRLTVSLAKQTGWFFTSFDYREVYALRNPFRRVPPAGYFTPDEILRIRRGDRNDTLNRKIEEWDYRNVFEEYHARLVGEIGEGDRAVNPASLAGAKEELFRLSREDTSVNGGSRAGAALKILSRAFGTPLVSRYAGAVARVVASVDSMQELRKSADVWTSTVVMPGTLTGSNADSSAGSELMWTFEAKRLLVTDYAMDATSRVTNLWAFAATAGAVLLLLIPVGMALRRRRMAG